jgi:peroxiredoxin
VVAVGEPAPLFALPSLQGPTVELAAFRGRRRVLLWFSRGFTCPFCLDYMQGIVTGYADITAAETEVVQVAPNLLESARSFLGARATPYPFVCDADKRLYAVYGLGDRGALEATRTAVVSFSHAVAKGDGGTWVRGAWHDVANRNFLRRLHHHAMTALEQGLFLVDKHGIVRQRITLGPIEPLPPVATLADLARGLALVEAPSP